MRLANHAFRLFSALIVANVLTVGHVAVAVDGLPIRGDANADKNSTLPIAPADPAGAIPGDQSQIQTHLKQAEAWRAKGRLDMAAREFEAAVERGCDDPQVYQSLGNILMQREPGERGVAYLDIADYTRGIQKDPEQAAYYLNRGLAWLQLDHFDRAIMDFTVVLSRQPRELVAVRNRGYAYWLKGDRIRAAMDLAHAQKIIATDRTGASGEETTTMDYAPGDIVVPWETAPFREGDNVMPLQPATLLRVQEARPGCLRVAVTRDGRRMSGWVESNHLALVGLGPAVEARRFVGLLQESLRSTEYVGLYVAREAGKEAAVITVLEYSARDFRELPRPRAQWTSVLRTAAARRTAFKFLMSRSSGVLRVLSGPPTGATGPSVKAVSMVLHAPHVRYLDLCSGTKAVLSERTQEHLILVCESDYPANRHALIVAEPHFRYEGQVNVLDGLATFLDRDNPHLLQPGGTVFLAEGCPAGQTLSVDSLAAAEPRPDRGLLSRMLATSTIPGYLAYEWQHRHGIPVIGCEDSVLYRLCARRHLENWERLQSAGKVSANPYVDIDRLTGLSVAARNGSIARTLLAQLDKFQCPILFVGDGHIGPTGSRPRVQLEESWLAGVLSDDEAARLRDADLRGIADLLREHGVGFYLLVPRDLGAQDQTVVQLQLHRYFEVFRRQLNDNETGGGIVGGAGREVTVVPWPEKAVEVIKTIKMRREFFQVPRWWIWFFRDRSAAGILEPWFLPPFFHDDDYWPDDRDDKEAKFGGDGHLLMFLDGVKDVVFGSIGLVVGIIAASAPSPITTPVGILIAYSSGTQIGSGINKMINAFREDPAPDVGTFEGLGLLASHSNPVAGQIGKLADYGLELAGSILGRPSPALENLNLGPLLGTASDIADAIGDAESLISHAQDAAGYTAEALAPLLDN